MWVLQKKKKNSMCVLSPHVGIAKEEEKANVGFEPPSKYCKRGRKI
jgi:hypothetical protein